MVQKLAIIAVTGLGVCAVCIGAAAAIGSQQGLSALDWNMFDGRPRCALATGPLPASRDMAWDGSDRAGLALHATANYAPGNDERLHATGDPQILAHLRLRDGTVEMDCHGWRNREGDVTITLPGRTFAEFDLAGTGKMNLARLNQDRLKIKVAGVATIKANGKVGDLSIDMAGVSHADFGQVTGRSAHIRMAGVSKADIAPSDEANIEIAGPSEVTLHSSPAKLDTQIAGPGPHQQSSRQLIKSLISTKMAPGTMPRP